MLKKLLTVTAISACAVMFTATSATAAVLNFDDLNTGGAGAVSSSAYSGFTLNGWWHIDNPPYSYPYASSPTTIYNSESAYTNTPEIISSSPIDVLSIYLADYNSGTVDLLGYSGSSLLYSLTVDPVVGSMTQYTLNFNGIDRFVMQTTSGVTYAFMDNFEYVPGGNSVPEPASLALLGLGFAGLVLSRRKIKA